MRALVVRPQVILADEITSALDASTAAQILAILRASADTGTAVLLVTHDVEVAALADRTISLASAGAKPTPR